MSLLDNSDFGFAAAATIAQKQQRATYAKRRIAELRAEDARLREDVTVMTNEGTYGATEAMRMVGTGDPAFANSYTMERLDGSYWCRGCSADERPGRMRSMKPADYKTPAQRRKRIAEIQQEIRRLAAE